MSRPKPTVLLEHVNKSNYKSDQVLDADGIYAVFYDAKPINLKTHNILVSYPGPKYKKVSFSNPGHAINLAKKDGLYIVEGPGDLMQLYRLGILNAVAVCGTAFTESHLLYLKTLGIKKIFLNFDWDKAGYAATQRVLESILKATSGVSCYVVTAPKGSQSKDPDEYLKTQDDANAYLSLDKINLSLRPR